MQTDQKRSAPAATEGDKNCPLKPVTEILKVT